MQEFGPGTLYPARLIVLCIFNYMKKLMTQELNNVKINKSR